PGRFQISRAAVDISDDLVVNFSLGGSALSGSDYKRVSGIAVIPANELTADIMIESIQDTIQEGPQTVILKLAANSDYAIGDSSTATVTIADNDGSQFSIQGTLLTVNEPAGTSGPVPPISTTTVRPFRVFRPAAPVVLPPVTTPPTPPPVRQPSITVKYQVVAAKSTARASSIAPPAQNDYVALYDPAKTGELIFEDTDLFKDISVVLNSDDDNENAETLTIELVPVLPGAGYTLGFETEATTLILDNDRPMMDVSYADSLGTSLQNFSETSTGLRFYFSRTGGTTAARTVNFTFGGSALQGTDFTASHSSEITIPAGRTGEYLDITLLNDNIPEGTETLTVNVGAPTVSDAYGVRFGSSTIFIDDNDLYTGVPPPEVSFETTTSTVAEGASAAIKVNLNAIQPGQVRVSYRLAGGSATGGTRIAGDAGVDYTFTSPNPISGALVFAAGETVKTFTVPTRDDSVPEGDETILFELFNPSGANLVGSRFHTVTLNDNSYPEVLTDEVGNRPNLTAELRGRIIPHNLPTTAWFEWGTSPTSFPNRVDIPGQLTGSAFVPISTTITGLKFPGTYYYRAVADNTKGVARGIVRTIRTLAAPTVTTTVDAGHNSTSITAAGTINPNRGIVDFYFEYGLTDTLPFGNITKTQSLANGTKTVVVTALITEFNNGPAFTEGTGIYYRLVAGNRSGVGGLVAGETQYATAIPYKATGDLIVNIQASQPSAGTASWQNLGKPGGAFAVTGAASLVSNVHGTGVPGVFFDGKTAAYELSIPAPVLPATTPPAPWPDVIGTDSRTIEVWALNPGYGSPDTLLNMGRDGLTETQLAISHSNLAQTETALSHGTKNASYTAIKLPLLGRWNHFVYVYNGPTKTANLYVNGVLNTTVPALTLATTADPITVGAARDATGVLGKHLQGYINSVRIHGGILSVPDIVTNFNLGPAGRTPAPTVLTTGVSDLTTNTVTLNGLVAPGTATSSAWIEWGTSTTYDNASAPISVAVSPVPTPVTLPLANLVPGVEYHYRAVASNAQGVTVGNDVAFTPRVLASRGRLWVDLSAREFTDGTRLPAACVYAMERRVVQMIAL
ncbi:MAG: hypothetical protein NTV80_22015, partial [Verrucomicrobia bacterium]|nr:hypothetical protein [Verrucomicrobiota bacterium]